MHAAKIKIKVNRQNDSNEEEIDVGKNVELKYRLIHDDGDTINLKIRSCEWVRDEQRISINEKLVINSFEPDKAGSYRCKVTFKRSFNHWVPLQKVSTPYRIQCKGEHKIRLSVLFVGSPLEM
jgi:hypothetical protein